MKTRKEANKEKTHHGCERERLYSSWLTFQFGPGALISRKEFLLCKVNICFASFLISLKNQLPFDKKRPKIPVAMLYLFTISL